MLVADATRARELLGWSTERSDLAMIPADTWRWHRIAFGHRNAYDDLAGRYGAFPLVVGLEVVEQASGCRPGRGDLSTIKNAYPLLYQSSFVSFRVTDIGAQLYRPGRTPLRYPQRKLPNEASDH
jgi:hypothetical protein